MFVFLFAIPFVCARQPLMVSPFCVSGAIVSAGKSGPVFLLEILVKALRFYEFDKELELLMLA